MRRKKLLLLVVIFVVSGSAIMQILKRIAIDSPKEDTAYIRIEEWGMPDEVEIPRTGETDAEMLVPTPNEVASLSVRSVNAKQVKKRNDCNDPIISKRITTILLSMF